ncbi:MAG: zinc ribbon domain-containing protein, partial [Anaerolineae bacterium]|nr:zinc ribbon domain-containing protein [Anaerolineae bacterium]
MSEGKTYEMLWDCQFCGTKRNLGLTHRFCPNCGAPQNPDARYYPSDEDKIEVRDHEYVGVDVTCPACGELNSAAAEFCGQCGSP